MLAAIIGDQRPDIRHMNVQGVAHAGDAVPGYRTNACQRDPSMCRRAASSVRRPRLARAAL